MADHWKLGAHVLDKDRDLINNAPKTAAQK